MNGWLDTREGHTMLSAMSGTLKEERDNVIKAFHPLTLCLINTTVNQNAYVYLLNITESLSAHRTASFDPISHSDP